MGLLTGLHHSYDVHYCMPVWDKLTFNLLSVRCLISCKHSNGFLHGVLQNLDVDFFLSCKVLMIVSCLTDHFARVHCGFIE